MRRWLLRITFTVALLGAVLLSLFLYLSDQFTVPGPLTESAIVIIPPGTSLGGIAGLLARSGVIDSTLVFILGVRYEAATRELQAGEYAFPTHVSGWGAMDILRSGDTVVRHLTIPEGLTNFQVVQLLRETEGLQGDIPSLPGEGMLLPETYHFSWGDTREDIVLRMYQVMTETLREGWNSRAPGLPLKNPGEALVLASIVEKETALAEERPRIAAVFLNRLRRGMRLQSDPTVVYDLTGGKGVLGRPLAREDLKQETPSNTYVIDGLPPAPISNPGRLALQAVLHPAVSDDLYFVADGSGGHSFSGTLAEHNRNVARWRKIRDKN